MKRQHLFSRLSFYSLIAFLLILGISPVMAQDGDPLPLPGLSGQSQPDSDRLTTHALLPGLLNPANALPADPASFAGIRGMSRAFTPTQQIIPPVIAGDQGFGVDLAREGNVLVVGAPLRAGKGAAIVYTQDASGAWGSPVILTAADGAADDNFGINVAILGDLIMVGSLKSDSKGAVYVFKRDVGGNWVHVQKLQPTLPVDSEFGAMIRIDPAGDQMLIGSNAGLGAFLYRLQDGLWQYEHKFTTTDATIGLSIRGNRAFVSNVLYSGMSSVLLFEKNAGAWTQIDTLVATDLSVNDRFGGRILDLGDQVLILGDLDDAGAVYVFRQVGGVWTQQQKMTPSDGVTNDGFGISYAVQDDTLVIGSAVDEAGLGSVYIFKWNGSVWVQHDKIPAVGGGFGIDLSLHEGELLAGAPYADANAGKVHAYRDVTLVPSTELLTDGGFESNAAGWNIKNPTGDKVKCNKPEKSKVFAHTGNCAFMFKGSAGENAKIQQTITSGVNAGDSLAFSGYVNARGAVSSKVKIVVKYADGVTPKSKITVNINAVTGGVYIPLNSFQPMLTTTVTAPIDKIKVVVKNNSTKGKVFYDALSLTAQ